METDILGSNGAIILIPQGFAFLRSGTRILFVKFPGGFAKGSSETSADTIVGARQQSSAIQENHILNCSRTRVIC
jgi:hypothetical protein